MSSTLFSRRSLIASLAGAIIMPRALFAGFANGDPRLDNLYRSFIPTCCWQENLSAHRSPKADEMRTEIQQRIAAGESDEQIKNAFAARYGPRVLAMPEGNRARWLFWTPAAAIAAGLGLLALFLKRSLKNPTAALVVLLVESSCARIPPKQPEHLYSVRGTIMGVDAASKLVTLKHERIQDANGKIWMEPMTMEFPVRNPNELAGLQPGQRIQANLHQIESNFEFWIAEIKKEKP